MLVIRLLVAILDDFIISIKVMISIDFVNDSDLGYLAETLSRSNELQSVKSIQCRSQISDEADMEFESTSPDRGSVVAAELERPKQGLLLSSSRILPIMTYLHR
jgi:hypothetical protein